MLIRAILLACPLLLAGTGTAAAQRPTDGLAFLAGCWQMKTASGSVIQEMWLTPAGGMLLGASRTVRGDTAVEFETMRIYEAGDTLIFAAHPSGQPPAEFRALAAGSATVTFENLAHDFPQRIGYRAAGADSLTARLEGVRNGTLRGIDFKYGRIACTSH